MQDKLDGDGANKLFKKSGEAYSEVKRKKILAEEMSRKNLEKYHIKDFFNWEKTPLILFAISFLILIEQGLEIYRNHNGPSTLFFMSFGFCVLWGGILYVREELWQDWHLRLSVKWDAERLNLKEKLEKLGLSSGDIEYKLRNNKGSKTRTGIHEYAEYDYYTDSFWKFFQMMAIKVFNIIVTSTSALVAGGVLFFFVFTGASKFEAMATIGLIGLIILSVHSFHKIEKRLINLEKVAMSACARQDSINIVYDELAEIKSFLGQHSKYRTILDCRRVILRQITKDDSLEEIKKFILGDLSICRNLQEQLLEYFPQLDETGRGLMTGQLYRFAETEFQRYQDSYLKLWKSNKEEKVLRHQSFTTEEIKNYIDGAFDYSKNIHEIKDYLEPFFGEKYDFKWDMYVFIKHGIKVAEI